MKKFLLILACIVVMLFAELQSNCRWSAPNRLTTSGVESVLECEGR